ncbi:MAG: hypothetical protein IRZ16_07610 [Myxococcaceae bacterium]|nr:hypothetical protein [Myxococcaceae bacterium]
MQKLMKSLLALALLSMAACGPNNNNNGTPDGGDGNGGEGGDVSVTQPITEDTTWTADKVYHLKTNVFVKDGATLTIEPGTKITGEGTAALVVTREGKLNAVGTAEKPIVFTSFKPEGERKPGDWGGVVMLGKARINVKAGETAHGVEIAQDGETYIEGINSTASEGLYGGSDDTHDCGKLKYARIEFAGIKVSEDNELNGLSLGGCGSKTEIDYVQIHKGNDDGIEAFGGTANLKHIVISQPDDDGLDFDLGYRGKVQFVVIQQNESVGNNGFEWDDNPNNKTATPQTLPTVYNVSIIGSGRDPGVMGTSQVIANFKNGAAGHIYNLAAAYVANLGVDVAGDEVVAHVNDGDLFVKNSLFWSIGGSNTDFPADATDNDSGFDENQQIAKDASNVWADPMLDGAKNLADPNFKPAAGSPLLDGATAAQPPADGFFDAEAKFIGAVGTTDWTAGWTAFPAN